MRNRSQHILRERRLRDRLKGEAKKFGEDRRRV